MEQKRQRYLSISQMNTYLRCPLQYHWRYVKGIVIPPKSALTFGKAIHSGLEYNYRQKKETHKDLKADEICQVFSQNFNFLKKETLWEPEEKPGELKDEGIGIIRKYQKEIAPAVQPVQVEEEFEVKFDNFPCVFRGIIDLVDDKDLIIDHKTTKRSPTPDQAQKDLQVTAYSLGHRVKYGKVEKGLRFDYIVRRKTPKIVQLSLIRTQEDIDRFLKLIAYVAKAIDQELFYPQPHNFSCNEKSCGYWEICKKEW
jgi:putative RecB family exonuclease